MFSPITCKVHNAPILQSKYIYTVKVRSDTRRRNNMYSFRCMRGWLIEYVDRCVGLGGKKKWKPKGMWKILKGILMDIVVGRMPFTRRIREKLGQLRIHRRTSHTSMLTNSHLTTKIRSHQKFQIFYGVWFHEIHSSIFYFSPSIEWMEEKRRVDPSLGWSTTLAGWNGIDRMG